MTRRAWVVGDIAVYEGHEDYYLGIRTRRAKNLTGGRKYLVENVNGDVITVINDVGRTACYLGWDFRPLNRADKVNEILGKMDQL